MRRVSNRGCLLDNKNQNKGTSMKLCPIIKDRNVYIFCGPSGSVIPKPSTNAPAKKADIIDEITTSIAVRTFKVLFIFTDLKLFDI